MSKCKAQLDLCEARKKLDESLGDNKKPYYQLLKQWFQMKLTREDFYLESRQILSGNQIKFHNSFLLNLFNTCQFPTSSQSISAIANKFIANRKKDRVKNNEKGIKSSTKSKSCKRLRSEGNFEYANYKDYLPTSHPIPSQVFEKQTQNCHQEFLLPDAAHIRGRLLLSAWENGMDGASQEAAECLVEAVRLFLKNILTSVFSRRSGYKVREGRFQHSFGCLVPNPALTNTSRNLPSTYQPARPIPTKEEEEDDNNEGDSNVPQPQCSVEEIEQRAIFEIASSKPPTTPKAPVSAFDLLEALQSERKSIPIPSHIVYSINIARIIARLHHPTQEELEGGHKRRGRKSSLM